MPIFATILRLLRIVGLFIFFSATMDAGAQCVTETLTFPTPTIVIPPNVEVGDVLSESNLNFIVDTNTPCRSGASTKVWAAYGTIYGGQACMLGHPCGTNNSSIDYIVELEIEQASIEYAGAAPSGPAVPNQQITFRGIKQSRVAKARLKYVVKSLPISSTPVIFPRHFFGIDAGKAYYALFNVGTSNIITATCNIPAIPPVMLEPATSRSFSGSGAVSRVAPTSFNIQLQCSGNSGAKRIGVKFLSAYQDASLAPGVIKVDQGAGKANGVALRIVNTTTNTPIMFDTLEPGPTPFQNNGANNFPFSVQYFQTGTVVTPGRVTARAEVSVAYE